MGFSIDNLTGITLGQQGENLAQVIRIDISSWLADDPDLGIHIVAVRHGETVPYIAATTIEDNELVWPVTNYDTAVHGTGRAAVIGIRDSKVIKSRTFKTRTGTIVPGSADDEPPEQYTSWIEQVLAAADIIETTQQDYEETVASLEQAIADGIDDIQAEGTTQVGAVQSEGTTQVGAVQAKGEETLASIPSDYTELSDDVTVLKSAINVIDEQFPSINGVVLPPAFEVGLRYVNNGSDTWVTNNKRLTFKRGNYIKLKQGDTVTRDKNVLLEFGGGYSTDNGSSFTAIDSRGDAYTVPTDGIYFFWMTKIDSSAFASEDVENGWKYLSFTRSGSIAEDIDALESIRSENRLTSIDGTIVPPHYDIGVRYVSNGADVWGLNAKRMSFKKGTFISLKAGDKVSRNASFISEFGGGYSTDNGASFIAISGKTSTYSAPANGIYFFWTSKVGDTNFTDSDVENSFNALYFSREPNTVKTVESIKTNLDNLILVPVTLSDGFYSDEGTIQAQTARKEKYTQKYDVVAGMTFNVSLKFIESAHDNWTAVCEWLNDGTFYRRTLSATTGVLSAESTYTPGNNVVKVAFIFRGYDDFTFTLSTTSIAFQALTSGDLVHYDQVTYDFDSHRIKGINHRGYYTAPENTIPAYKLSAQNGFTFVETDVRFTSDGVPVLLHDATINRTARNADGTSISSDVNIVDITYEQAYEYDFGVYKDEAYAGTKIPTFEEFIVFCRNVGLSPYIEISGASYTSAQVSSLVSIVKKYNMQRNVTWLSFYHNNLLKVVAFDPCARVGRLPSGDSITAEITKATDLRTGKNEVFIDFNISNISSTIINLCISLAMPLEVWTTNSEEAMIALDDYVSGVTSDQLNFEKVLHDNELS